MNTINTFLYKLVDCKQTIPRDEGGAGGAEASLLAGALPQLGRRKESDIETSMARLKPHPQLISAATEVKNAGQYSLSISPLSCMLLQLAPRKSVVIFFSGTNMNLYSLILT